MRLLLSALLLLAGVLAAPVPQAVTCTQVLTSLPATLAPTPGAVVCLRAGVYTTPRLTLSVSGTASQPITLQAYPGEVVRLVGTSAGVLRITGDYWVIADMEIDGAGKSLPIIEIAVGADFTTVRNMTLHHSGYEAVEVRGNDALVEGSHIYDVDALGTVGTCVMVYPNAHRLRFLGNTVHDCWGSGLQMLWAGGAGAVDPAQMSADVEIRGNVFYRGDLPKSEDGIASKQSIRLVVADNSFDGYGAAFSALNFLKLSRDAVVENNTIHDSGRGITLSRDQGQVAEDLTFRGNQLETVAWGLYLSDALRPTFQDNVITDSALGSVRVVRSGVAGLTFIGNRITDSGPVLVDAGESVDVLLTENNIWTNSLCGVLCGAEPTATPTLAASPTPTLTPTPTLAFCMGWRGLTPEPLECP